LYASFSSDLLLRRYRHQRHRCTVGLFLACDCSDGWLAVGGAKESAGDRQTSQGGNADIHATSVDCSLSTGVIHTVPGIVLKHEPTGGVQFLVLPWLVAKKSG